MVKLQLEGNLSLQPGECLRGAALWSWHQPPEAVEIRLFWYTRGRGDQDVELVQTVTLPQPAPQDRRDFTLQLPPSPYSFSGKLISLVWAVELVMQASGETDRVEFVMAPGGREILLAS